MADDERKAEEPDFDDDDIRLAEAALAEVNRQDDELDKEVQTIAKVLGIRDPETLKE